MYANNAISTIEYCGYHIDTNPTPDPIRDTVSLFGKITANAIFGKVEQQREIAGDTENVLHLKGTITEQ